MAGKALEKVTIEQARMALLAGQGLLDDPAGGKKRLTPAGLYHKVERMGFVQVDTISTVERAHQHILHSRCDDYRPEMLTKLLERDRKLFEHWTHDASIIPTAWWPHWQHRFKRYEKRAASPSAWWRQRIGKDPQAVIDHVIERITKEGALRSADFEHERTDSAGWWGWKPQKAALEHLWRAGMLSISKRVNFHKYYDLTERVLPEWYQTAASEHEAHIDWACTTALDRLGFATSGELFQFFRAITSVEARQWCTDAKRDGRVVEVIIESNNGTNPRKAFAFVNWKQRLKKLPGAPDRMRLLSPFDPVLRDRDRTLRLFSFDYRFEAFVPAPKRKYGYYVLPILDRDALVGRIDAKTHRDRGELVVNKLWWEPRIKPTRERTARLNEALERLAQFVGAERVIHGR